jgi:hypothetical protein
MAMQHFEELLSPEIKKRSRRAGNEWVLNFADAQMMVAAASAKAIAILGVEIFEVLDEGYRTVRYSGYDFICEAWPRFVELNNQAARDFIFQHQVQGNYGCIFTSTSRDEFLRLRKENNG